MIAAAPRGPLAQAVALAPHAYPAAELVALTAHEDPTVSRTALDILTQHYSLRLRLADLGGVATHTVPAPGGDTGVVRTLRPVPMEVCGERNNGGPRG